MLLASAQTDPKKPDELLQPVPDRLLSLNRTNAA